MGHHETRVMLISVVREFLLVLSFFFCLFKIVEKKRK